MHIKEAYPYLRCKPAAAAIEFYKQVFGAQEIFRLDEKTTGRIGHAELKIGDTLLKLSDEYPEIGALSPLSGGSRSTTYLLVDNVEALAARMVAAGATMIRPPSDQFYGHRACKLQDPYGHEWMLSQHIEDVSYAEMQRRYDAMFD